MRTKLLNLALAVTLSSATLIANAAPTYTFRFLESLGGTSNHGSADSINNSGEVVGTSNDSATYWTSINPTLPAQLLSGTNALSINNSGQILGNSGYSSVLVWSSYSANPITVSSSNNAYSINNSGQIAGESTFRGTYAATLWSQSDATGTPLSLPLNASSQAYGINDTGKLVGYIETVSGQLLPTLWSSSTANPYTFQSLGGAGKDGEALRINNSDRIIGHSQNGDNVYQATLWNPSSPNPYSPTLLSSIGGEDKSGQARGVNNSGLIVGWSADTSGNSLATLWDGANPPINLDDYLDQASKNAGWVLSVANDINDSGSIVGMAFNTNSLVTQAFLLQSVAAVPEADTSAMLLMGAGVMGFMARRRKQVAA